MYSKVLHVPKLYVNSILMNTAVWVFLVNIVFVKYIYIEIHSSISLILSNLWLSVTWIDCYQSIHSLFGEWIGFFLLINNAAVNNLCISPHDTCKSFSKINPYKWHCWVTVCSALCSLDVAKLHFRVGCTNCRVDFF